MVRAAPIGLAGTTVTSSGYPSSGGTASVNAWDACGNDANEITVNLVEVVSIAVSGAHQIGTSTNYGVVKAASGVVTLTATLSPNTDQAASAISWSAGDAVTGAPRQHTVSKTTCAETPITVSCNPYPLICLCNQESVDIWVLWATLTPSFSGAKTYYNVVTGNGNSSSFPTPYSSTGDALGCWNNGLTTTPFHYGCKTEIVATICPSTVKGRLDYGWLFVQDASESSFNNSTTTTDDSSGPDLNFNSGATGSAFDQMPDSNGQVFAMDCPGGILASFGFGKHQVNLATRLTWAGDVASDDLLWYFRGKAHWDLFTLEYVVDQCTPGTGNPAFDTSY